MAEASIDFPLFDGPKMQMRSPSAASSIAVDPVKFRIEMLLLPALFESAYAWCAGSTLSKFVRGGKSALRIDFASPFENLAPENGT